MKKNIISASDATILRLKALAKEKESVRHKLATVTAAAAAAAAAADRTHLKDLEQNRLAILNVLEDLQVEKEALINFSAGALTRDWISASGQKMEGF